MLKNKHYSYTCFMTSILKLRELMIFMHHHNEEDAWWNNIPYEIECKGEIECYDKINEFHPKYPIMISF